jgi:hypothetical protein
MLVLRLALETIRPVHFSCLVVPAVDEHSVGVQPLITMNIRNTEDGRENVEG